jgi:acyl-CoA oxidase
LTDPGLTDSLRFERELALERMKRICEAGHISVLDFERNPLNIFAAHEVAGYIDGSMATKMTVQVRLQMALELMVKVQFVWRDRFDAGN